MAAKRRAKRSRAGLDDLPPVVQLLLREMVRGETDDIFKLVKGLIPELQRQAKWTLANFDYKGLLPARNDQEFTVGLIEGLDPFIPVSKCEHIGCRIEAAKQIARSVGIYADRAVVPDLLTDRLVWTERWTEREIVNLAREALILLEMSPLLASGVFQFYSPYFPQCRDCGDAFEARIEALTTSLLEEVGSEMEFRIENNQLFLDTSDLLGAPLIYSMALTRKERNALKKGSAASVVANAAFAESVSTHIRATLNTIRFTSKVGGTAFSDSRVGLMAARRVDGKKTAYRRIQKWEAERSATLPWIGDLSLEEVLRLRQEAGTALPRFRHRMTQLMTAPTEQDADESIDDLRTEAIEVEEELKTLDFPGRTRARGGWSMLGLTVSLYGLASDVVGAAASATGLVNLLHSLHQNHSNDQRQQAQLMSKPSYVLVKAKELVQHRDHQD